MKILLTTLNSKYVHSNLALKYLYGAASNVCPEIEIKEFTINNSREYIYTELVLGQYDLVCFSCYIWNIEQTLELAEDLKKAQPRTFVALGGPEVSYDSVDFLREHGFLDFIMTGEGEKSFPALCEAVKGQIDYSQVPGLTYWKENKPHSNFAAVPVFLEAIQFPYKTFPCEKDKVVYYESTRGCPYQCSYCMSSLNREIRKLPVERVISDLGYFIYSQVKQVKFLDRTFNWDKARSLEIFKYLIAMDNGITNFHFEMCGDLLDEEMLEVLETAREGLFQFEIGIQSVNKKTLLAINRSVDTGLTLENVRRLVKLGNSHIHVDLIAGLPFEDYASFRGSFDVVYGLNANNLQLGFLKLLKGTEMRDTSDEYGYVYKRTAPYEVISNRFITAEELCKLKQIETVLDLYHNRGGFEYTLSYMIDASAFDFFEAFAAYYYQGYQHKSHKKEDLYRILYEYAGTIYEKPRAKQFLELDLENTMNFDAVKKFKRKGWSIQ